MISSSSFSSMDLSHPQSNLSLGFSSSHASPPPRSDPPVPLQLMEPQTENGNLDVESDDDEDKEVKEFRILGDSMWLKRQRDCDSSSSSFAAKRVSIEPDLDARGVANPSTLELLTTVFRIMPCLWTWSLWVMREALLTLYTKVGMILESFVDMDRSLGTSCYLFGSPCNLMHDIHADPGWKYCHSLVEGDTNTIVCNFCGKITKGGITRAKQHLIGKSGNVAACKKTPPNVVEELKEYMATKKSGTIYSTSSSGNMANIRDFEFGEPIECDESEEDEFADSCNVAASVKTKRGTKKGPMDKFCKNPENAINRRKMEMLRQMNIRESLDKNEVLKVHQHIARFWYQAGLSFNLIKLKSFENMVAAIGQYGPHFPIPSYHDIRVPLLKKEVEYTKNLMKGHREQWVKYDCTIMSDAWTDRKQRCIINFFINSQAGTMFLKSVDGSNFVKTGEKIFELLDAIVEEVGEENVVQVVTDNGSNYVLAGKLLEEKRKHIYWTPCAAHCIDLMLEDIGKLPLIRKTIRRAINLVGFIYAHSSTLSLLRNFTNKRELVRQAVTRFATSFWNSVVYTLKVMAPLVKVLRLVDGERKPAMGYIYEAMDKAKETIIKSFNNNESKYKDVFAIIDKRWNCQLHRPLHAAAHFLNPEFFYDNTDLEFDFEVTTGLFECIKKLIPQFDVQQKILTELHLYKIGAEHFGSDFAMAQRKTHSLTYWWRMFGSQTPNLHKLTIKILSLTCSASGCERNWSVFEQIHSKKRNRLEHKRLHDLVFVKYNQLLKQRYNVRDEIDPISLNDIDVCNEWLVGEMDQDDDNDAGNDLVFKDDDALNWATVYQASGVGECRMHTRQKKQKTTSVAAAQTSKKQAMVVGSSSRKQKAVQENDEDIDFEENIDLESEEEEFVVNFEASDGEEGEGDAPLPYDNNEDDYEWGDPRKKEFYFYVKSYSPVDNASVKGGVGGKKSFRRLVIGP
ncbi:Serine hydroxymethyltransferase 7 [Glycine soja]